MTGPKKTPPRLLKFGREYKLGGTQKKVHKLQTKRIRSQMIRTKNTPRKAKVTKCSMHWVPEPGLKVHTSCSGVASGVFSSSRFPSPLEGSGFGMTSLTCLEPPASRSPVGSTSPVLRSLLSVFLTVLM